jgi:hypothetical protein
MNNLKRKTLMLLVMVVFPALFFAQNAKVTIDQPKALDKLLEYKKDLKTVDVFKIQIYSGNSESQANKTRLEFQSSFEEWPVSLEFNTPNYKVWVGNFIDRLEADRALKRIKEKYMYAFIFQPKKD